MSITFKKIACVTCFAASAYCLCRAIYLLVTPEKKEPEKMEDGNEEDYIEEE